jgi:hypothetical protein
MQASILLGIFLAGRGAFAVPVAEPSVADLDCPLGKAIKFSNCFYICAHLRVDKKTVETDPAAVNKCNNE